jgi:hypothetical protein
MSASSLSFKERHTDDHLLIINVNFLERKHTVVLSMVKGAQTSMMPKSEQSTMIAVFINRDPANQAIDNLRQVGFSYDQIRLVEHGSNSFVESIKSMFTGQSTATTNSADDWMRIGVPEQDAHYYQSELDAGRSIVLIKAVGSPEQALTILRQSGAYDLAFRFRTAPPVLSSSAYTPNTQAGASNPPVAQGAYNPNVAGTYNPNPQQGTSTAPPPQPVQPQQGMNEMP